MAKYLMLKHYRTTTPTPNEFAPMDQWTPEECEAHFQFMRDYAARLEATGEMVGGEGLSPEGTWVRSGRAGEPAIVDGPFAETKDLIAGWFIIDVDSYDRALELARELSDAPGQGGEPIHEWLELREIMSAPPTIDQ